MEVLTYTVLRLRHHGPLSQPQSHRSGYYLAGAGAGTGAVAGPLQPTTPAGPRLPPGGNMAAQEVSAAETTLPSFSLYVRARVCVRAWTLGGTPCVELPPTGRYPLARSIRLLLLLCFGKERRLAHTHSGVCRWG